MNTAAASQPPPSIAELVRTITEEAQAIPEPTHVVMHLPRPHLVARVLVITVVFMIAGMASLLLVLTSHVQGLMADIRVQEELRANPPLPPLPAAERLLDPATFAIECAARPAEAGRLHAARAQVLVGAGRAQEAIEGFAIATRLNDRPLAPADQLALGEAYYLSGQLEVARALLLAIDVTRLDESGRARANDCLGRLTMAQWRAERRRLATGL
jgi:hypothetical protein